MQTPVSVPMSMQTSMQEQEQGQGQGQGQQPCGGHWHQGVSHRSAASSSNA